MTCISAGCDVGHSDAKTLQDLIDLLDGDHILSSNPTASGCVGVVLVLPLIKVRRRPTCLERSALPFIGID